MDAYTTALTLLARRELSAAQIRTRLARRKFPEEEINAAIDRLLADRTLDDRRVAVAAARMEGEIRHRGRRRVLQRVQQLGVDAIVAKAAVDEVFGEIDERALLDRAVERVLKGTASAELDERTRARVIRRLMNQGFEPGEIYKRLKTNSARARRSGETQEN